MSFTKYTGRFDSSNGKDKCAYYIYIPQSGEFKGIIQISHGMCEYLERYERFAAFMTEKGYIVCGNDHIGHGSSVENNVELGYFAEKDGWSYLVNDLHRFSIIIKKKYPTLPFFLMGHSMGSFIARLYITRFPNSLSGIILLGTGDDKALGEIGVRAARSVAALKGEKYRSEKLNSLAFGVYNDKIENKETLFDWLTHDKEIVRQYIDNPKTNFIFTASAYVDLTTLLRRISSSAWVKKVPKKLPILFASGTADPVGNYGKGVINVYEKLINEGCLVDIKLYPEARHELINETIKEIIFEDLLDWIERKRSGHTGSYEFR